MTANELAEALDDLDLISGYEVVAKAQAILRQQQDEYYSLLVNHDKLYAKVVEQQAEIEALKAKTLTDEEILDTFDPHFDVDIEDKELIKFARAILKKASEK
jgi:hypothetical protein